MVIGLGKFDMQSEEERSSHLADKILSIIQNKLRAFPNASYLTTAAPSLTGLDLKLPLLFKHSMNFSDRNPIWNKAEMP